MYANPRKELYIQPVKAAKKWAKLGLETREKAPKSYKGGLDTVEAGEQGIGSGVARARDIVAGKKINAYQVKAFFDRHRGFYQDAMAEFATQDKPLKEFAIRQPSIQSWWLWGGEPLRKQVERAVAKDKKKRKKNPYREERFLYEGVPAALAEKREDIGIGEWWERREAYRGRTMTPEEIMEAKEEVAREQEEQARMLRRKRPKQNPIDRPERGDPHFDYLGRAEDASMYRHILTGSQVYLFVVGGMLGERLEAEVFDTTGTLVYEVTPEDDSEPWEIQEYQDTFTEHRDVLDAINRTLLEDNPTPTDPILYEQVKAEIKDRYEVWPSAYASGALVQEYKRRGGGYVNPSQSLKDVPAEELMAEYDAMKKSGYRSSVADLSREEIRLALKRLEERSRKSLIKKGIDPDELIARDVKSAFGPRARVGKSRKLIIDKSPSSKGRIVEWRNALKSKRRMKRA